MTNSPQDHVHLRASCTDDVEALSKFIAPFVTDRRLLPRTSEELGELVKTGFVAEVDQQLVGFAALEIYSSKLAEIRSLAVSPIHQGLGIGKKLVNCCVKLAREQQVLEVMAITSTEEFFQGCGFDFILPRERKALFLETHQQHDAGSPNAPR